MKKITFEMNKIKYDISYSMNVAIEEKKTTELFSLLSTTRQEKAARFKNENKRSESVWAGYQLEELLRTYGVKEPFSYQASDSGKPMLITNAADVDLPNFSISHSRNCASAVVSNKRVGIDMERIHPAKVELLANRFFCKDEIEWLKEEQNQLEKFFTTWTFKEAICKCKEIPLTEILRGANYLECKEISLDNILSESNICCKSYQYQDCIILQWQESDVIMSFCGEV